MRERVVALAGVAGVAGVVVVKDDGSGVLGQRLLDHLPRIDRGLRERAPKQALVLDQVGLRVEIHDGEDAAIQWFMSIAILNEPTSSSPLELPQQHPPRLSTMRTPAGFFLHIPF